MINIVSEITVNGKLYCFGYKRNMATKVKVSKIMFRAHNYTEHYRTGTGTEHYSGEWDAFSDTVHLIRNVVRVPVPVPNCHKLV